MLERYPWLLPLVWALERSVPCDPIVLAGELGVSARLARSLVYWGSRLGFCDNPPGACIVREGRVFIGLWRDMVVVARVRGRRVSARVFKLGYGYVGGKRRVYEWALERLKGSCLAPEEPGS